MHNPFLIVRLVFMSKESFGLFSKRETYGHAALLVYLNLVILAFASWNIHATTSGALPGE